MSIALDCSGLTTVHLRNALKASARVRHAGLTGPSIPATDGNGRPFVGLDGPDAWSMTTVKLTPEGALAVLAAIVGPLRAGAIIAAMDEDDLDESVRGLIEA